MPSEDKDLTPWGGEGKVIALNKKHLKNFVNWQSRGGSGYQMVQLGEWGLKCPGIPSVYVLVEIGSGAPPRETHTRSLGSCA